MYCPQDEMKISSKEIHQGQESLADEIKVLSEEVVHVQGNLQDEIKVVSSKGRNEGQDPVQENFRDEIKMSFEKINQVQEKLQSSITWSKPKRIRWKNFTSPEKLQSTIVISIKRKFSPKIWKSLLNSLLLILDKATGKVISAPDVDQNYEVENTNEGSVLQIWEIKWHRLW